MRPSSIEHIFMIPPFQCYVFSDPLLPVVFYETLSRGQYFYDRLSILHVQLQYYAVITSTAPGNAAHYNLKKWCGLCIAGGLSQVKGGLL